MNYWQNKKILITGVNGFIGGNLAIALVKENAKITGLIRNSNQNSILFYEGYSSKINLIYGEICDKDLLYRIITEEGINIIFHLAAQVEVGVGMINPYLTFETNIKGTYSLLEAVRMASLSNHNLEAIIIASSDKSYGAYGKDKMPYREDYPLIPKYPYDTSKACADLIAQAYASEIYELPIAITRFANIFGPGQLNFSAIIPDAIRSTLGYSQFVPRSDGSMVRDFIFVSDVVRLYLLIAENLAQNPKTIRGQVFNAGTNSPISVKELLHNIFSLTDNLKQFEKIELEMQSKVPKGEIDYQHMSYEKVKEYFGWEPKYSLTEGLSLTITWFQKYLMRIL